MKDFAPFSIFPLIHLQWALVSPGCFFFSCLNSRLAVSMSILGFDLTLPVDCHINNHYYQPIFWEINHLFFFLFQEVLGTDDNSLNCNITHKDAKSALKRVKSQSCRNELYKTICDSQYKRLYWNNITRYCPVPREKGRPSHSISTKIGYGPPIRILYAMVVHGRAFRQVKRLFKALYHTNHYFFFHVDSVIQKLMFFFCIYIVWQK